MSPKLETAGQIDGKQYFIVEDWGFIAPLYRADKVQPAEDSWSLLWDDRYAGRISWINTLEMLVIAGYYHGVSDPWTMTDDELGQMRDFLISKKHLVSFMWDQSYDLWTAFKKGDIWIGYAWPDTVGYATTAGMDVVYMQPKEGRIWWSCGIGLSASTKNYRHAHDYVDSWSSTKAAAVPGGLLLLRSREHEGRRVGAPGGHGRGAEPGRSVGARGAQGAHRVLDIRVGPCTPSTGPRCRRHSEPFDARRGGSGVPMEGTSAEARARRASRADGSAGRPPACSPARCCGCCCSSSSPVVYVAVYSVGAIKVFPTDTGVVSLDAWRRFLGGSVYLALFWKSLRISLTVSVIVVVLSYPSATSWRSA